MRNACVGRGRHDTRFPWRSSDRWSIDGGRLQLLFDLKLQSFVRRRSPSKERAWGATKGMKTLWNIFIGSRWSDRAGGYAVSSASGHKTDHY